LRAALAAGLILSAVGAPAADDAAVRMSGAVSLLARRAAWRLRQAAVHQAPFALSPISTSLARAPRRMNSPNWGWASRRWA